MEKAYQLRFRHLDGDVGPLALEEASSVAAMKAAIFQHWPTEGPLAAKKPESEQHLRIMYQGKILQDVLTIADLKQLPGDILPERAVTLHLVIASPGQLTAVPSRRPTSERPNSGCCCIQ